jgi:hypothetical protein
MTHYLKRETIQKINQLRDTVGEIDLLRVINRYMGS